MRALYKNETASTINHTEEGPFLPGQSKTLAYFLDDPEGLTLVTTDKVSPWETLFADTIANFSAPITGLAVFRQITITNNSGDVLEVTGNDNATEILYILTGATWPINQNKRDVDHKGIDLYSLSIDGSGDGKVYIIGWK